MFNTYDDAKKWFNDSYKRFSVTEDFDLIIINIRCELIDLSGFSVGSEDYPYKSFDSKHDFVNYCDLLKKLYDMGVNYLESEY